MALRTKVTSGQGNGDFARCPVGNHPAVCVAVIGAGTHSESFQGAPPEDKEKVVLVWEVEADDEDGTAKRFHILKDFTLSGHEKSALRQLLAGWFPAKKWTDGDEIDLPGLASKPCLLTVDESKSGYPKVKSAAPLVKGMTPLKPSVTPLVWDIEEDDFAVLQKASWLPYIWGEPLHVYAGRASGQVERQLTEDGEPTGGDEIPF